MDLVSLLARNVDPVCTLPLPALINVRSFYSNLADQLRLIADGGPNKERIRPYLDVSLLFYFLYKYINWT